MGSGDGLSSLFRRMFLWVRTRGQTCPQERAPDYPSYSGARCCGHEFEKSRTTAGVRRGPGRAEEKTKLKLGLVPQAEWAEEGTEPGGGKGELKAVRDHNRWI